MRKRRKWLNYSAKLERTVFIHIVFGNFSRLGVHNAELELVEVRLLLKLVHLVTHRLVRLENKINYINKKT